MKIKNLFNPKVFINELPNNKISALPIVYLVITAILTFVLAMFGAVGQDYIKIVKTTLAPLNQISGPERFSTIFRISIDVFVMLLLYLIIYIVILTVANLVIKLVLKLFKKEISLYKLMNISVYAILASKFLILILSLITLTFSSLLLNISELQAYAFITVPLLVINLSTLILYIYGVVVTTKNKFIPN